MTGRKQCENTLLLKVKTVAMFYGLNDRLGDEYNADDTYAPANRPFRSFPKGLRNVLLPPLWEDRNKIPASKTITQTY